MPLEVLGPEVLRQQRRVRRAARRVRKDKHATAMALQWLKTEVIASPAGLAACTAVGFGFDRLRRDKEGEPRRDLLAALRVAIRLIAWMRRLS